MSDAIESQGFKLEMGAEDSPFGYNEVKEVKSFTGFDGKAAEIDVTHLQSTAKEFLMGLQDFGGFNVDCNYLADDTGQSAMRSAKADRSLHTFKLTFADASTAIFQGYVLSNSMKGGVDASVEGSFQIRITGPVNFS